MKPIRISMVACILWGWIGWHGLSLLPLAMGQTPNGDPSRYVIPNALIQIQDSREVPAQIAGLIQQLEVHEGAQVKAGQSLARLDAAEVQLALDQSKVEHQLAQAKKDSDIEMRYAQKSKQVADAEYQRAVDSNLKFPGVVSDTEMDRLRLTIEKHDAEQEKTVFEKSLLGLQCQLALISQQVRELELSRHVIRAPIDGMVVEIRKKDGEWLERAEPVFRIIGLDRLRIEELVPQSLARGGVLGRRVDFYLVGEDGTAAAAFNGRVSFVSPEVNPVNDMVKIWIEIENREGQLSPGLRGRVEIRLD